MRRHWVLLAAATGLALASHALHAAPALPVAGVVTRVIDGDTLVFQPVGQPPVEVRLRDIDAPESCQPWGVEAKKALEEMALGKPGTLAASGRDTFGRTVGSLTVDGQSLGKRLVEDGHAWSARYKWDRGPLVKQERQAKALSRGLHAQGAAMPPREFRRLNGPCPPRGGPAPIVMTGAAARPAGSGVAGGSAASPALPVPAPAAAPSAFRCDGRTRCQQLGSCAEARYFLAHCPGVKIDGDGDGIPCEDQLCAAQR